MENSNNGGIADALQQIIKLTDTARQNDTPIYYTSGDINNGTEIPYVVVPDGHKVISLKDQLFHEHRQAPTRIEQTATFSDAGSLIDYINRFRSESVMVGATRSTLSVEAVLDYHVDAAKPRWARHRAKLALQLSDEWRLWLGKDRSAFSQVDFAEFIEDNARDIVEAADMLEVSRGLYATKNVNFRNAVNLSNGTSEVSYSEEVSGAVRNSSISIPQIFTLEIPVFRGEAPVKMAARFRYRLDDGKLKLYYVLNKPDRLLDAAFEAIVDRIGKETGQFIYR